MLGLNDPPKMMYRSTLSQRSSMMTASRISKKYGSRKAKVTGIHRNECDSRSRSVYIAPFPNHKTDKKESD